MKAKMAVIVALVALVSLTGCVSMFSKFIFSPTEGELDAGGKTIAVVAGLDNDMSIAVAESMGEALSRNSTLRVLPSKQIERRIQGYPQQIKGPYNSAYLTIDINYEKTDIAKVKTLMKKLGTDYVYVIWVPGGYSRTTISETGGRSGTSKLFPAVAQMFAGPDAKVVGQGRFDVSAVKYIPFTTASDEDVKTAVADTTETVSKIVAENSKALKR